MRIVLVGEESAGSRVLKAVMTSEHELIAVLATPPTNVQGRSALWQSAEKAGLPTWPAQRVRDPAFTQVLRDERVDVLLNVHSLVVFDAQVLDGPRLGCFNLHPGPLPEYAGLNTVSWALYRGERKYGVTLHKMAAKIDAGEIVYQIAFEIEDTDNALAVYSNCLKHGLTLIQHFFENLSRTPVDIPLTPQDASRRRYFKPQPPNGGRVIWTDTARQLHNFVRACDHFPFPSPWGYPRFSVRDQDVAIAKAELTGIGSDQRPGTIVVDESGPLVACGDEWLRVKRLLHEGSRVLAADLLRSGDVAS